MSAHDDFQIFDLERYLSLHEQGVDYNLAESGVEPVRLGELLSADQLSGLLDTPLGYPHVNGIPQLRERVAELYPATAPHEVLITVGAAEANYLATNAVLGSGDAIAVMVPNYLQTWGIAHNLGIEVREFHLRDDGGWHLDLDELNRSARRASAVAICNPNNPTGHILTDEEIDEVVAAADHHGAWIISDEVYRGAERTTEELTPSLRGRYERVLAVGSLSKAFGLPGLRIGWVVGPRAMITEIWKRHEYVAISATMLANHLAARALEPATRASLLERTRDFIRRGYGTLETWMSLHPDVFSLSPPQASAVCFTRYDLPIGSAELGERLHHEKGLLVVPGVLFGMDHYLRISFGLPQAYLTEALRRLGELIADLQHGRVPAT